MNPEQLLDEWTDGETNGMRAARIQAVRDDLMEYTGEFIPRRIPVIEATITSHPQRTGVITRKLREAAEGSDGGDEPPGDGE